MLAARLPVVSIPHGGGPWPFVDARMFDRDEVAALRGYLTDLPGELGVKPKALLIISAHWEAPVATVTNGAHPPLIYDYLGFPPAAYQITWPAPGDPVLAEHVSGLLRGAGFATAADAERGFDHGTFVPLKVAFPDADIPTVQLSLLSSLDAAQHLAMGRALEPLRNEGVLIIGSGMSYHNMRGFGRDEGRADSARFDAWLKEAATAEPEEREGKLIAWRSGDSARAAHPREEHLLPLMVVAGAAGSDRGVLRFNGTFGGARISAFQYG